jgi:hypothetical protein
MSKTANIKFVSVLNISALYLSITCYSVSSDEKGLITVVFLSAKSKNRLATLIWFYGVHA